MSSMVLWKYAIDPICKPPTKRHGITAYRPQNWGMSFHRCRGSCATRTMTRCRLRKLPLRSAVPSSPMRFTEAAGVNIVDQDLLGAGWRLGLAGGDGFLFSSRRDLGSHDLAATGVIRDHPSK